jgi:DNA-binding transcriptional LysR family regulator
VALQVLNPLYRELRDRNVDLILGPILKQSVEADLTSTVLFHDAPVVTAGTRSKWARLRSLALADLMDQPWCLQPQNTRAGQVHIASFRGHGLDIPRKTVITSAVQVQIGLLGTQRFLTIFPNSLPQFGGKRHSIKALPIKLPIEPLPVGIITLKRRSISPVAKLFIDMAREVTKPLAAPK